MARRCLIAVVLLIAPASLRGEEKLIDIPVAKPGRGVPRIGLLHQPLRTAVTVQGVVVDGPHKGYEGGPNICVQRINGRATQEHIQIKLTHLLTEFGKPGVFTPGWSKLESGQTFEFQGAETGEMVGFTEEEFDRANAEARGPGGVIGIQAARGQSFIHRFVAFKGKKCDPIRWSPDDFIDREALLAGKAVNDGDKALIEGAGWRLLTGSKPWSRDDIGKEVESFGTIRPTDQKGTFRVEKGTTRLVRLKDQVGRAIVLRGTAWSLNGEWWFAYRGTPMYIEGMQDLPGWNVEMHAAAVEIRGLLDEAMLPEVRSAGEKDAPRRKQFIVRKPTWKPVEALLGPERSRE